MRIAERVLRATDVYNQPNGLGERNLLRACIIYERWSAHCPTTLKPHSTSRKLADRFLDLLPGDGVPYW
jgi:hypothetical protein